MPSVAIVTDSASDITREMQEQHGITVVPLTVRFGHETYLDGVMALFHEDVLFENWTGARVRGKDALRQAWESWFQEHGGFRFFEEETLIDEVGQKALYRWRLEWPSMEPGFEGEPEVRRGVDVIHFSGGKIRRKLTYSKTTLEMNGERVRLGAR